MAKGNDKHGEPGRKQGRRGVKRKLKVSRSVEVTTKPLFDQAEIVKGFAALVLDTHDGPDDEKERLKAFIKKMDTVQASIQAACRELDLGGNPMYRSFTIKS